MKKIIILLGILLMISCTEAERTKNYGGQTNIDLPCGMKLTTVTWKGENLWYNYIPMEEGYIPVKHTFQEKSSYNLFEGKVIIKESNCE